MQQLKTDYKRTRLDVYKMKDEVNPMNSFYQSPEENFLGPIARKDRRCTNCGYCCCCLLFILVVIVFITYLAALGHVDYDRYYKFNDFRADMCGIL